MSLCWVWGRFPIGGHRCTAMNSPIPNGSALPPFSPKYPNATTKSIRGVPCACIAASSTASCGICTPVPPGVTSPNATAPGRPPTTASTTGAGTAPGLGSSMPCSCASTSKDSSTATCGWSMLPSSVPAGPPPGRKKNPEVLPHLGGPESMQVQEPQDHALGRSQGGFGTKIHLVCDGHGIVLAVWVTPGQCHESQAFTVVLLRAKRPRQAGRCRWPRRVGADKGYSYPGIRAWLRRHHLGSV